MIIVPRLPILPRLTGSARRRYAEEEGEEEERKKRRLASLEVLGVLALEGQGVREAVDWLFLRVQNSRKDLGNGAARTGWIA